MYKLSFACCSNLGHMHARGKVQEECITAMCTCRSAILDVLQLVRPHAVIPPSGVPGRVTERLFRHPEDAKRAMRTVLEMIGAQYYPDRNTDKTKETLEYVDRLVLWEFLDFPPILVDYCIESLDSILVGSEEVRKEKEDVLLLCLKGLAVIIRMKNLGIRLVRTRRTGSRIFELIRRLYSQPSFIIMAHFLRKDVKWRIDQQTDINVRERPLELKQLDELLKMNTKVFFEKQCEKREIRRDTLTSESERDLNERYGMVFSEGPNLKAAGITQTYQAAEMGVLGMLKENLFEELTLKEVVKNLQGGFQGNWCFSMSNLEILWNFWYFQDHLQYYQSPLHDAEDILQDLRAFRRNFEGEGNYDLLLGIATPTDVHFLKDLPLPAIVAVEVKSNFEQNPTVFQELSRMRFNKGGRHYVLHRGVGTGRWVTLLSPGRKERSWFNGLSLQSCREE